MVVRPHDLGMVSQITTVHYRSTAQPTGKGLTPPRDKFVTATTQVSKFTDVDTKNTMHETRREVILSCTFIHMSFGTDTL